MRDENRSIDKGKPLFFIEQGLFSDKFFCSAKDTPFAIWPIYPGSSVPFPLEDRAARSRISRLDECLSRPPPHFEAFALRLFPCSSAFFLRAVLSASSLSLST